MLTQQNSSLQCAIISIFQCKLRIN